MESVHPLVQSDLLKESSSEELRGIEASGDSSGGRLATRAALATTAESKSRLGNIQSLRGLTICLIVMTHTTIAPFHSHTLNHYIKDTLNNTTCIFTFIAGYLFQYLHKRYQFGDYFRKKYTNVLLPYIVTCAYSVYVSAQYHRDAYAWLDNHSFIYRVAWLYLHPAAQVNYPLWFMGMIVLLYLSAPVFSAIVRHPRWYLVIVPLVCLSALIHRSALDENYSLIHMWVYFIPIYMSGMWFSQQGEQKLTALLRDSPYLAIGLCFMALISLPMLTSIWHTGNYAEPGYFTFRTGVVDWNLIDKLVLAMFLVVALRHFPAIVGRTLDPLGNTSFAIYFVHYYWIRALANLRPFSTVLGTDGHHYTDPVHCLLLTATVIAASHGTAVLVKFLAPNHHRMLIGY
jgi:peptidoglycan/LPS O-acetylase OafA/YrhL